MKTVQRNRHQPTIRAKFDQKSRMVRLNVPLSVKAETIDMTARTFEGLAATWDEDLGQDVIHKGAFKSSIVNWKSSGEAMPLLNSHDHYDIFAALGQAVSMKETADGLWAKWEVLPGDDGDKVLARLRPSPTTGRAVIGKMSIGFVPTKYSYEQPDGTESFFDRVRHIEDAELKEVSLVLFPMNPNASIDASTVKMWLKMAHDQDPAQLDQLARLELRRLNSKIGLLLKKQKPKDEEELDLEDDEQESPSTRKSAASKKKKVTRKTETDSDDETDDSTDDEFDGEALDESTDDSDDDHDDSADDEGTDDGEGDEEGITPPKSKPKTGTSEADTEQEKTYIFSEALSQRLKSVTLKHKTSALKDRAE